MATSTRPRKIDDPAWRRERARKAGLASQSIDGYIKRLVDHAPELTAEQRDRLAGLLRGTGTPDSRGAA